MTVVTDTILASHLRHSFDLIHVDTSDHRPVSTVARFDPTNLVLALRAGVAFVHELVRHDVDLVYIPIAKNRLGFLRDTLMLLPARVGRRNTVVHFHAQRFDDFFLSQPRWMRRIIILALKTDRTYAVVLGDCLRDQFDGIIPRSRVHVVANGVVDYGLSPTSQAPSRPTVLHLSTLWGAKGVFDVLASAVQLRAAYPDIHYVLGGDWYSAREAETAVRFIAAHGLTETVTLCGPVAPAEKRRLLAGATVMAFPSYSEGHPLVLLEALSASLPVVASDVGAIGEIIRDGKEGFLVSPGDVGALADRLGRILADPRLRENLGAAARLRYEMEFTEVRFASRLGAVWSTVSRTAVESDVRGRLDVRNLRTYRSKAGCKPGED